LKSAKAYFDLASGYQAAIEAKEQRIRSIASRFRFFVLLTGFVVGFSLINMTQEPEEVPEKPIRVILTQE
jgi:hypothetical protein